MKKPPLSEAAKQRDSILRTINRTKSDWSFGRVKTFRDLLSSLGLNDSMMAQRGYFASELDASINKQRVWEFLDDLRISHDVEQWLKNNPLQPDKTYVNSSTIPEQEKSKENQETGILSNTVQGSKEEEKPLYISLPASNKEAATLFAFQKKAALELLDGIFDGKTNQIYAEFKAKGAPNTPEIYTGARGQLLRAGVGTGKTFILGAVLRRLIDIGFHHDKTYSPFPYIYVTKASVVEQTKRVLKNHFGIDPDNEVVVINIEQLRAKFGQMFLKEKVEFELGQERVVWHWRKNVFPCVIIWDECQSVKNEDSIQSKIAQSYNEIDSDQTVQIFSSATPFTRVSEAKCFSVATRVPFTFGIAKDAPLTNSHWSSFAETIANPAKPIDHSPGAIDRLMDFLDDYIVQVKGVKSQFRAINSVKMIEFDTESDKIAYHAAWEEYLIEKAKLEGDSDLSNSGFLILVQFLKFRQKAELLRARYLARTMWEAVNQRGKAAVSALNFKPTMAKIAKILIEEYGVPRDQITIIWGGITNGSVKPKKKKKADTPKISQAVLDALAEEGMTLEDLGIEPETQEPEEDSFKKQLSKILTPEEIEKWNLGPQSLKARQKEIDRFQSGKSLYCLYSFKAGGVGLSLHHTDEQTDRYNSGAGGFDDWYKDLLAFNHKLKDPSKRVKPGKVRHKDSGYAVEEDIKYIPTRPREVYVAPTYSAIELVQGTGRCPRLTSLSDTEQYMVFYREAAIEMRVAYIVSVKLKCLTRVVRQKESWESLAIKTHADDEVAKLTKPEDNVPEEDTGFNSASASEIEDEEEDDNIN